ncbi:hypothetical protein AVEN_52519-1 [Araneus ventricosus]|uniref:Uncharacterized protein n=1 Tax=Araneus ventricosus TaxID=182803 RepID=A0A4Y2M6P3_ARAVE|nr:hypothetical protein AVEN_52519-1 [Araneus ventricosus]
MHRVLIRELHVKLVSLSSLSVARVVFYIAFGETQHVCGNPAVGASEWRPALGILGMLEKRLRPPAERLARAKMRGPFSSFHLPLAVFRFPRKSK